MWQEAVFAPCGLSFLKRQIHSLYALIAMTACAKTRINICTVTACEALHATACTHSVAAQLKNKNNREASDNKLQCRGMCGLFKGSHTIH